MNAEEIAESLSGFDEIAIEKYFREPLSNLSATMQARALCFIMSKRELNDDKAAFSSAMNASLKDIMENINPQAEPEGKDPEPQPEIDNTPISSAAPEYRSVWSNS
jgi:hypothetical protein